MNNQYIQKYKNIPIQVKASLWFLICAFLQKGISVITTPIFTRLLSTQEYGEYSVWNSWLGIVSVFVSLNLYSGVFTSGLVCYDNDKKNFVSSFESLNFILCIIWAIIYIFTRTFWNNLFGITTIQMCVMLIMIWTTSVFYFWSSIQRVNNKYKCLVIITLIMSIGKPLLGIILVSISSDKVTARIVGLCIVELLLFVPLFIKQIIDSKQLVNVKYWKYALTLCIPLIPHYLSQVILNSSDRIMIAKLVGDSEAGIYNLAYSIALIMTMFNTALIQTMEPWLYGKLKNNRAKDVSKVAYCSFILIASLNILLILLGPEAVTIFAPQSYKQAVWLIPPIAMSVFFMFEYTFFAAVEFYYKKTQYISIATVTGAVINLVLNYICINVFGYQAAAYTTLICYILYAVFHYIFMCKLCASNLGYQIYDTKIILMGSIFFVFAGFACMLLYLNTVIRYSIIAIIMLIIMIFRKKIIKFLYTVINMRKSKKDE